jgi:acyl-coenzyme A thioesterase PaaI-like protein
MNPLPGGTTALSLDKARAALAAQPFSRLLARAWVISAGQRLIVTRCELIEPQPDGDRLSAIAQGTIARTT